MHGKSAGHVMNSFLKNFKVLAVSMLLLHCGAAESVRKQLLVSNDTIRKVKEINPQRYDVKESSVEAKPEFQKVVDQDRCQKADKALAMADANALFTQKELDKGDYWKAERHIAASVRYAQEASQLSDGCKAFMVTVMPPPPPPVVVIQEQDRDGDTVIDRLDKCPDTPGLPELEGCPEVKDTDGDGLPDDKDKCPNDPEDFDGDRDDDGCPDIVYDRDGDGINDDVDKCPDQPEDFEGYQDTDGCPEGGPPYKLIVINREAKRIELKQKVFFDTAKSTIKPESFDLLNEVGLAMKDNPGMEILIEGHTDSVGGASYNMKLSQDRADSVKRYLEKQGVESTIMEAVGFGLTKPIADNKTSEGRDKNRRVEFKITKQPSPK